jgi:hypothetical protein
VPDEEIGKTFEEQRKARLAFDFTCPERGDKQTSG